MTEETTRQGTLSRTLSRHGQALAIVLLVVGSGAAFVAFKVKSADPADKPGLEVSSQSKRPRGTDRRDLRQCSRVHP